MAHSIQTFKKLSGVKNFRCDNYHFVDACVALIKQLKTKYPRLTCKADEALCGDGYNCHMPMYVTFQLNEHISITIDEHSNKHDEYHLSLNIRGRIYCNWKTNHCHDIGITVIYYERAVMKSNHIIKLTLEPKLEIEYNQPRDDVKILDKNSRNIGKRSVEPDFSVYRIIIPPTTLVSSTTRSYADMVAGK